MVVSVRLSVRRALCRASVASVLLAPAVHAQSASTAPETVGLEEVVVTAERREQNQQSVPISVTVLTGDDLVERGVDDLNDVQQVAPSIAINTYNRSTFVNIRGVGIAQSAPTSNPGVAYYIDGQLVPHEQFIGQSFFDIGSIEVLRGPQGTLTGQNSTGGAIYVRTPEPIFGSYGGTIDQTFASDGWSRTVGAANLGFSDNVALRVAAVHDDRDSFTRNIGPSRSSPGNSRLDAARLNLAMRFSDRARANLRYEYFDYDTDNNAVKNRNDAVTSDPFTIEEDARSFLLQSGHRASGELHFDLTDTMELRGLVSFQDGYTKDQTDGDRTATAPPRPPATNVGRVSYARTDFETDMYELNLLSKGEGPLQWVVGAFALDEDVPVTLLRDNNHVTDFVSSTSTIVTKARNTSYSGFGQVNYFFTDAVEVLAGARYSADKQVYNRIALPGPPPPPGTDTVGPPAKSNEVTGKVGLNYHLDKDTMFYGTASKGYKAGGVNLTLNTPNFAPETNNVYELGAKTLLANRRLRVNGDVFYSDYKDIQLSSLFNGLPLTQNAASGEAYGAELEITGQFGDFGVNLGASYLQAEFARDTTIVNTVTNLPQLVHKGDDLPFSPNFTANVGIDYTFHLGTTRLTPRLQWAHVGEQLATPFPSEASIVPSRDIFDARLSFEPDAVWRIEAFVTNFTDKVYIASQVQNSSSADGGIIYGPPRQYGVRVMARFGD
ncbi:MAG TPA: TonB-dependent receptor [Steroidobacteraceae bacterium]|nr:TonB-dependent receptor [Steroidobacteraceae bacterium]